MIHNGPRGNIYFLCSAPTNRSASSAGVDNLRAIISFLSLPTYEYIYLVPPSILPPYPPAPSSLPVSPSISPAPLTIGPVAQGLDVPDCLGRSIGTARATHVHYAIGNHGLLLLALALLRLFSRGPGGDWFMSSVAVRRHRGSVKPSRPLINSVSTQKVLLVSPEKHR